MISLSRITTLSVFGAFSAMSAFAAPADHAAFFDAATCKPPYSMKSSMDFSNAAEKLAKYELVGLTAVYNLPKPIAGKDGLKSQQLVMANNSVGVLLDGAQADALATRFQLKPERLSVLRAAITKGYSRALPDAEQPAPSTGVVSIAARESKTFPGKTMLICEMLTHSEIKALQSY